MADSSLIGIDNDSRCNHENDDEIPDENFGTLAVNPVILAAIEDYNRRHQMEARVATFTTWKMDFDQELESDRV